MCGTTTPSVCFYLFGASVRMSLRGGGPRGVGNLVTPIIPLYSLSFPKVPQGSLVPSPLGPPPPLGSYISGIRFEAEPGEEKDPESLRPSCALKGLVSESGVWEI